MRRLSWARIVPLLKLGTKIIDKIPTRKDTWPQKIAKVLALMDAADETIGNAGRGRLRELQDQYGLVEKESETFVRMFFATTLRDLFELRRTKLSDHEELIEAVGKDGERMFFRESHWDGARVEADFYMTPGIDFARVIDRLWANYPDGIYLSVTVDPGAYKKDTTVCEVPPANRAKMSRHAVQRLDEVTAMHRQFVADGVHRCYLAHGPAGTGKSSFAVLFAKAFGGRALKLDATSLPLFSVKDLGFLIDTLNPGFLIIDDIDRAPIEAVGPRILFMLERLKTHNPRTTIVLTVNDTSKLDSALLRCGRIDIPIGFDAPERDEMEQMIEALLIDHKVPAAHRTHETVQRILNEGEHLTHAYLEDLCRRLRHEEVGAVLTSVNALRALAQKSTDAGKTALAATPQAVAKGS